MASPRRLERSAKNRVLAGVIGGLGEYLGVDATLLRIAAAVLFVISPIPMLILYFLGVLLIPRSGEEKPLISSFDPSRYASLLVGLILIVVGAALLGSSAALSISMIFTPIGATYAIQAALAVVLIIVGALIMAPSLRKL